MPAGKLIVLTGPSGVGKGTLVRALLGRHPELSLSISATTRSPRTDEIDGQDYYFLSRQEFEAAIAQEELLEWAEYTGNYYGTPRAPVEAKIREGKTVLLEIEVVGAGQIQQAFPEALRIFILPPSFAELERRLRGRSQDDPQAIARRLQRSQQELTLSHEFDQTIVNDDLETALQQLEIAIFGETISK